MCILYIPIYNIAIIIKKEVMHLRRIGVTRKAEWESRRGENDVSTYV